MLVSFVEGSLTRYRSGLVSQAWVLDLMVSVESTGA